MTEEEKERLIKKDIVSIENRVRHAFNQGYEMGLKERQNTCDDAISRQSAIFLASDLKQDLPDDERIADMVMAHNEGILEYQSQLSLLPSVKPQYTGDEIQKMQDLEQAEIQKAYELGKAEEPKTIQEKGE